MYLKVCRQHQLFWSQRSLKSWLSLTDKTQLELSSLCKKCEFWKEKNVCALKNHKRIWLFSEFQWISIISTDIRQWIFLNTVVIIYIFIFCLFFFLFFFFSLYHFIFMWQQQYTLLKYGALAASITWLSCRAGHLLCDWN